MPESAESNTHGLCVTSQDAFSTEAIFCMLVVEGIFWFVVIVDRQDFKLCESKKKWKAGPNPKIRKR
jgi:hypothetical protein